MDASFWFFILFLILSVYFYRRIQKNEDRINQLESRLDARRVGEIAMERSAAPAPHYSQIGALEGALVGDVAPSLAPAPAPAPLPSYMEAPAPTVPAESQEETSARWLGRIGAFALFIGVAFFFNYLFVHDIIPESVRVVMGIAFGITLIGLGHWLRAKYLNYSDLLMASGIGVLYLSLYASYGFYHLLHADVVFVLMGLVTFFGFILAITGSSMGLAIFTTLGGFLTPVLLSTGENHLVTLSVYMIILDLGVLSIALFKKWTQLNYLSFIGTIFLFGGWMDKFYTESQLMVTFAFMTAFFFIFLATSIAHHLVRKEATTPGDMILLMLTATTYFGVSYSLLQPHYHDFLGFLALLLAVLYLGVAYVAYMSNRSDRTLNLFLPGISVVFLTIAVPLELSGYYIGLAWLVEAVVLIATGLYLKERIIRIFGWLVLALGFIKVLEDVDSIHSGYRSIDMMSQGYLAQEATKITPFLNWGFFLMFMSVIACYVIAYLYRHFRTTEEDGKRPYLLALFLAGSATAFALTLELQLQAKNWETLPWLIEGIFMLIIGLRLRSRAVEVAGWIFAAIGMIMMTQDVGDMHRIISAYGAGGTGKNPDMVTPFFNLGFFLYLLSIATTYLFAFLYRAYGTSIPDWKKFVSVFVILANLFTIFMVTDEIGYHYDKQTQELYHSAALVQRENQNYLGHQNQYAYGYVNYNDIPGATVDYQKVSSISSAKNTAITIFWAIYATLMLIIGFAKRIRMIRLFGLIFFFITAGKMFLEVWQLGQLARIVSSIAFGVIALTASFMYAKYKERLKEIVLSDN